MDSCVGANDNRIKMESKTNKNDVTIAVAGVIYQDDDPELGEVPDLEGYHQKEEFQDVKLGEDLLTQW